MGRSGQWKDRKKLRVSDKVRNRVDCDKRGRRGKVIVKGRVDTRVDTSKKERS